MNMILFFSAVALIVLATAAAQRQSKYDDLAKRMPIAERSRLELKANAWEIYTVLLGFAGIVTGLTFVVRIVYALVA